MNREVLKELVFPSVGEVERQANELLEKSPSLSYKIAKCIGTSSSAEKALTEVLKFLYLVAKTNRILSPSLPVDLIWHEFILSTKLYATFCETYLGRFIHHTPSMPTEEKKNHSQFMKTLQLYFIYFGEPLEEMWGKGAKEEWLDSQCGTCQAN